MGLTGLKRGEGRQSRVPSRGDRKESVALAFPASRGPGHAVAHGVSRGSKWHDVLKSPSDPCSVPVCKGPWDCVGPTWVVRDKVSCGLNSTFRVI